MRRTYQDLARAAEMKDLVTRAISGHATEQMQQHYSTVAQTEMRQGIAKIISLAGVRRRCGLGSRQRRRVAGHPLSPIVGDLSGSHRVNEKKAAFGRNG